MKEIKLKTQRTKITEEIIPPSNLDKDTEYCPIENAKSDHEKAKKTRQDKSKKDEKTVKDINKGKITESVNYPSGLLSLSRSARDSLEEFIVEFKKQDLEGYITYNEQKTLSNALSIINDFTEQYAMTTDNDELVEEKKEMRENKYDMPDLETMKSHFASRKKEPTLKADYSSEDLWYKVYDELSSEVENEGPGKSVDKELRPKKGSRYEWVVPARDNDIMVYGTSLEDLDFAKQVAEYYGCKWEEPKKDTNPATNSYYKYTMIIDIPEEDELVNESLDQYAYNEDSEEDRMLFDAISTRAKDVLFKGVDFDFDQIQAFDDAIDSLVKIQKSIDSKNKGKDAGLEEGKRTKEDPWGLL